MMNFVGNEKQYGNRKLSNETIDVILTEIHNCLCLFRSVV